MEPLDLVGLIVSRIAHEFAGPVSALENGATLLVDETDPDIRADFVKLLGEAAARLAARVRLHRMMLGTGDGLDRVPTSEVREALSGLFDAKSRVALDWRIAGETIARGEARLVLALAVLGADAMPRGGTLGVADGEDGYVIEAVGPRVVGTADIRAAEGDVAADLDVGSRAALGIAVRTMAARLRLTLDVAWSDDGLRLTAHRG